MSGTRLYNFREGDRSEYLANYLLSGIGLCSGVSRQEDIGVDFYCQLADNETGILSFSNPYIIQIKSDLNNICFGNLDSNKWKESDVNWLFKQNQPFFIGVMNKQELQLSIYDCSTLYHLRFLPLAPTQIEFRFEQVDEIYPPTQEEIKDWKEKSSDGFKHIITLGKPIITLNNDDFNDNILLKNKKDFFRSFIEVNQHNVSHVHKEIGWINYFTKIETNLSFSLGWNSLYKKDPALIKRLINTLDFPILNLGMNLKHNNEIEKLESIMWIIKNLKSLPSDYFEILDAIEN